MRDLPSGTVTLLFTDIEGSTRLLQELGDRYDEVLARHDRVFRDTTAKHEGVVVDTQGDAFFCAFARATDAVAAAAEAQQQLEVPVRMGVHTGEPTLRDEGYVGIDVHCAARICSAAHGGQVLVSEATQRLIDGASNTVLLDLGEHRLKDLREPVRLYQLGAGEFPPPRSLNQTNLPAQPTPLVGRERELADVLDLLRRDGVRLVTLTGAGGSGKTRLALEAAAELVEEYPDGVWLVDLAPLAEPDLVVPTIAQTIGISEQPGVTIAETLATALAGQKRLLVLDNFEHVAEAAPAVADLLARTGITVLATSRSSLHLHAEHEYAVPPLAADDAVALFAERARATKATFSVDGNRSVVDEICRRLDRLPLAIELAAARIKLLPEQALLERLDEKLRLLTGGARDADERQRTLRGTIDWSHDLLSDDEKVLLRRLAVFEGSRTLEAAEAVCAAAGELDVLEGVASLVDKSLLRREESDGDARFVMLETIHEYAREKLAESGETDEAGRRHAEYFLALAEQAAEELQGPRELQWFQRLEADVANLRAAIRFLEQAGDLEAAVRLAHATTAFWLVRGALEEQYARLGRLLEAGGDVPPALLAGALAWRADFAFRVGDADAALRDAVRATLLARELGDEALLTRCLLSVGAARSETGDAEGGRAAYEDALRHARNCGDEKLVAMAVMNLGALALDRGDWPEAEKRSEEALELTRARGNERGVAVAAFNLAVSRIMRGRPEEARFPLDESIEICRRFEWQEMLVACAQAVAAVRAAEEPRVAAELLAAAEAARAELGLALEEAEQRLYDQTLASLRGSLGEDELQAAWATGQTREIDELLAAGEAQPEPR